MGLAAGDTQRLGAVFSYREIRHRLHKLSQFNAVTFGIHKLTRSNRLKIIRLASHYMLSTGFNNSADRRIQ